jgi:hypothetical protein
MPRNPSPSAEKANPDSRTEAQRGGDGHASGNGTALVQDWLHVPLAAPKQAIDSLLEMQRQWLKTTSMGSETLALELKELQRAKDPVEFASAQFTLVQQQLEILTRQVAAFMQQIYDAQLLWIGQFDEKSGETPGTQSPAQQIQSALHALGRVQDEWLNVTQTWIERINSGSHAR